MLTLALLALLPALADDPTGAALPRADWGVVPVQAAPAPVGFGLSTEATAVVRGGVATFVVSLPPARQAPVYLVFSDEDTTPICPEALGGACVDITGGWLVFGPFVPEAGEVLFDLELPRTFHGDLLQAQAVVRGATEPWLSAVVELPVVGAPVEEQAVDEGPGAVAP